MNSNFEIKENCAFIKINSELYTKDILFQASYVLLDEFYFFIDKEEDYFFISMKPREGEISEENILVFYDELIEASAYVEQLKKTSSIREALLESALFSQKKLDEDNK
ncbi:MAG: hypothetical protein VXZ40_05015 [Nanoarchaeota archaeon]|nr:hypothetical protein [Nanoarchaeota archaeon]